jgi:hypothetical protein
MRHVPINTEPGRHVAGTEAEKRRLERAHREREKRIAEHGARVLAALRQRAPGTNYRSI